MGRGVFFAAFQDCPCRKGCEEEGKRSGIEKLGFVVLVAWYLSSGRRFGNAF